MNDQALFEALGELLGEEKKSTAALIDARLSGLDGSSLLKSVAGSLLASNLAALERLADDIMLRRAVVLSGEPSNLVKTLIGGNDDVST